MDTRVAFLILTAILAALVPPAWYVALRPRKYVRTPTGRRVEQSDIERLLAPLVELVGGRPNGRVRILRQLEVARVGFFTPETWAITKIATGPLVSLTLFLVLLAIGAPAIAAIALGGVGGAIGFLYPRVYLNGRLRRRQAAIARDVPVFLNLYARTAVVVRDTMAILEAINSLVEREKVSRVGAEGITPRAKRRRNPYGSDLWLGLDTMLKQRTMPLYSRGATTGNPDGLIGFSNFCMDPDINTWVDRVRQAREAQRHLSPEQADILVGTLQQRRLWAVRRSFARLQARATIILVAVNMPLLLLSILAPVVYVALNGF